LSFSNELTLLATSTFAVVARAAIPSIYKKIIIKRQQFITSGYCTVLYQLIILCMLLLELHIHDNHESSCQNCK
jgi:uncharacterized membrane protein